MICTLFSLHKRAKIGEGSGTKRNEWRPQNQPYGEIHPLLLYCKSTKNVAMLALGVGYVANVSSLGRCYFALLPKTLVVCICSVPTRSLRGTSTRLPTRYRAVPVEAPKFCLPPLLLVSALPSPSNVTSTCGREPVPLLRPPLLRLDVHQFVDGKRDVAARPRPQGLGQP